MIDLHMMMVCCEGRQRSESEMRSLLARTGFSMQRDVPLAAIHSLVVAVAA
jgi:hypothetical protein